MRRLAASALVVVHAGLGFGRRIVVRRRTRWVLMPSGTVGRVRACCGVAMMVRRGVFPVGMGLRFTAALRMAAAAVRPGPVLGVVECRQPLPDPNPVPTGKR